MIGIFMPIQTYLIDSFPDIVIGLLRPSCDVDPRGEKGN
jgi:hypothetical protein